MTDTKLKSAKYEMLTNVPVVIDIKYIDVWPDNGYGSQVSVKGTIDGETQTIYLKGKTWANLKALAEAGVIAGYEKEQEEPAEKINIPVVKGANVTLCRQQLPREKFANLVVSVEGTPSRTPGTPSTPGRTVKQPIDIGKPIPGLDDINEELPPVEEAFAESAPVVSKLDALFALHAACFNQALKLSHDANAKSRIPLTHEGVSALTAQLFIASTQRGITV